MIFSRKRGSKNKQPIQTANGTVQNGSIKARLAENIAEVHRIFKDIPDLVIREIVIKQTESPAALVYLSGLNNPSVISNNVLAPLLFEKNEENRNVEPAVSLGAVKTSNQWEELENEILLGSSVLFIDERAEGFIFATQGWPQRSVESPKVEPSLKGANVGFTESSSENIALIRRFISNRELKIKERIIGSRGKTKLSIVYLADVANPEVIKEIEKRINEINVDDILNTGTLVEYIEDNPYSPFPQLLMTERPDTASGEILEGRIVIVVDKSPSVLIGPVNFTTFFKSIDDYGIRWQSASFVRLLRYLAFFMAIFLPAMYIAVITFHSEIIPLKLLISIGMTRERVPFQPLLEALIMEFTLEMLREAAVRLPTPISQTVGVVGGIVIGQAAVEAGLVSNIMVIVVALTAISSFIIPNYDMGAAIRMIRFPMMILASLFGFIGVVVGLMMLIAHFITLESLGSPYGSPLAPMRFSDLKDAIIRFPEWAIVKRPSNAKAIQQQKANSKPPEGDSN